MSDKRAAGLDVQVDATGANAAFKELKDGAKGMGQAVKGASKEAGEGLKGLGDEAQKSSKKQTDATRNLIASMERYVAQTKAAGKSQSEFYIELAKSRGIDTTTEAFQRQIRAIKELELTQNRAGISAKQTANAMRGVPAQFTDIFVSLQGGQAPLTVFLQQGGQLKDMFGGIGNAARALGGYVLGLINPFTVATGAVLGLGLAYVQGKEETNAYNRALIMSGNAVGTYAGQLSDMAAGIAGVSGTQGAAAEALALFAQTGAVSRASLEQFTGAALRYASATGQAVGDVAKQFTDLAKDPLGATLKLNEGMNYLTTSTYEQIKALVEQGRNTEAANLAQKAYADTLNERTPEIVANLGLFESGWKKITSAAKGAWDFVLNIGRDVGPEQQLATVQAAIAKAQAARNGVAGNTGLAMTLDGEIKRLREQESILQSHTRELARGVTVRAEQAAQVKAQVEWDKEAQKTLSAQAKLEQDIARIRNLGRAAKKSEAEIEAQILALREKQTKPNGSAGPRADAELATLQARLAELRRWQDALAAGQPLEDTRTAGEKQLAVVREKLAATTNAAERAQLQLREAALQSIIPLEELQDIEKRRAAFAKDQAAVEQRGLNDAAQRTQALEREVEQQLQAYQAIGLSREQLAELAATRYEDAAATADQNAQYQRQFNENEAMAQQYEAQAKALRQLANLKRGTAVQETAIEQAKQTQTAWQQTAKSIEDSLTDALMRGFEKGKDFGEELKNELDRMFKSMVLRPIIQAVVGGATGLGSLGAMAGQGGGGGGGAGVLGQLGSLGQLAGLGQYFSAGLMNTVAGTGTMTGLGAASSIGGANGLAMGLGAVTPWLLGGYLVAQGLKRGPRVTNAENLVGNFSSTGASLSNVQQWSQKGGWLRQDKSGTISSSMEGGALDQSLDAAIARMYAKTKAYANVLGLPADQIDGYTQAINISLQGLSPEERNRKIQEALAGFGDALANVVGAESMDALQQIAERVLSERSTLELQILNLQGDTVAIRERERAAIHETNQALFDQVKALEDAKTLAEQTKAIMQERNGLQAQIDQLMGNTAAIRERERMALDETNRALYDQIKALEDLRVVNERQAAVMAERVGLQGQLDQAMGNTTAIRERERMALDETNRALYDQIKALEDTKTLAEQTAAALQAEAQERAGLQGQLDLLLGNTAAIRERERAALSESNRALYDQVKATEDAQAAAQRTAQAMQEQTAAAEQLQRAWDSIGASIRDQVQSIRNGLAVAQNQGYVALAAQFASATAQARSGNQDAANSLGAISQALLQAAAGKTTSRVEYQRIAALTAASLDATLAAVGQPTQASTVGTGALAGQGNTSGATFNALTGLPATLAPTVTPANAGVQRFVTPANAGAQPDPTATLRAELQAMREELAAFRRDNSAENIQLVRHTSNAADVLQAVSPAGTRLNIRAV